MNKLKDEIRQAIANGMTNEQKDGNKGKYLESTVDDVMDVLDDFDMLQYEVTRLDMRTILQEDLSTRSLIKMEIRIPADQATELRKLNTEESDKVMADMISEGIVDYIKRQRSGE